MMTVCVWMLQDPAVPKLARAGWEALKRTLLSYLGQDEHQQVASAIDGLRNTRTSITPYASTRRRLGENDSFSSNAIGGNHGVRSARGSAGLVLTDDRNYYSSHSAQSLTGRTQQQRPQHGLGHSPYNKDYHYNSGNGRDYDNVEYDYRFTSKIGAENSETRRMVGGEFSSAVAPFSERAAAASTRHAARPPWNEREEGNRAMLSSKSLIPTDSGYKGEDEHQWEVDFQRKYGYTGPGRGARMTTDGFFGTGMTAGNQEKGESGAPATHWRMAGGSHDAMPVAKMGTRHDGGVYKSVQSKRRRAAIAQQKSEVRQGI